jgi:hypothetical protein
MSTYPKNNESKKGWGIVQVVEGLPSEALSSNCTIVKKKKKKKKKNTYLPMASL